jgi:hypothetical protein
MHITGRPDFSDYVVHFTKDAKPFLSEDGSHNNLASIGNLTAVQRLTKMLSTKTINATPMPWTNKPAVCFTECTWVSLLDHSKRYSPFGIGFTKAFLFATGGAPAIYLRPDFYEWQKKHSSPKEAFDDRLWSFVTPFAPAYAPPTKKKSTSWGKIPNKGLDFTHEREWRVPHDLTFEHSDVAFVIVNSYEDMAAMPKRLKDGIGRKNFLIMDIYREIEKLWPVHVMSSTPSAHTTAAVPTTAAAPT